MDIWNNDISNVERILIRAMLSDGIFKAQIARVLNISNATLEEELCLYYKGEAQIRANKEADLRLLS